MYNNGKVAIPKLDRGPPPPRKPPPTYKRGNRVIRACKSCHKRKVKCSHGVPRCSSCQINGLTCVYEQTRRDRLREAIDLNQTFVSLFRELGPQLSDDGRRRVQDVIDAAEDDILLAAPAAPSLRSFGKRARKPSGFKSPDRDSPSQKDGEADITASVGSNEELDYLDEDLLRTRESRQTGFVGQNSEVQWLRSIQRQFQNKESEPSDLPYGPPGASEHGVDERFQALHQRRDMSGSVPVRHATDATFYLDSDSIEVDILVNSYELPDPMVAEQLLDCYFSTVHNSFPIIPLSFEDQARRFISSVKQNRAFRVPDRWRALLNLVFAIGAKYSHLVGIEWQGPDCDHFVYMSRASQLLGINDNIALTSGPDLLLVQATAVFSLYFLITGHVSRAWLMIGISIRIAMSLGLHLRNEVPGATTDKREALARTWWSLHSIECLISSVTGRPPTIPLEDCTVPIPKDSETEVEPGRKRVMSSRTSFGSSKGDLRYNSSASADNYLISTVGISRLTQKILCSLYAPRTAVQSWQAIQGRIHDLLQELEGWSRGALSERPSPGASECKQAEREHLILQMHYWSTKILITRPCLCRTERRIKNQSDKSAIFNADMAAACVASARALAGLFPDKLDLMFVYVEAPWWNLVHIIMQSVAVLLLEMGYQSEDAKAHDPGITSDIQKLILWLQAMGRNDVCADRAYTVLQRTLRDVAPSLRSRAKQFFEGAASDTSTEQAYSASLPASGKMITESNGAWDDLSNGSEQAYDHMRYSQPLDQAHQGTWFSPHGYSQYGSMSHDDLRMPNMFGNTFISDWDESTPFSGLQDL